MIPSALPPQPGSQSPCSSSDGQPAPCSGSSTLVRNWQRELDNLAERKRVWSRLLNAVLRGGGAGFAIRGSVNLVSLLLSLSSRLRGKAGKDVRSASDMLKDTLRYTAFLGALGGTYVGIEEAISAIFGKDRSSKWRALVAGALSGPSILLTGPGTRHTSLSLYILLRGIVLLVRCGNKQQAHPALRAALTPTRWQHGDTALMCASTVQIAYSWIFLQQTLPTSYVRFLNKHGGKSLKQYAAIKELCRLNEVRCAPAPLASLRGTPLEHVVTRVPCDVLHPGRSCTSHTLNFFPRAWFKALPVYLPVYVVPALLVHRQRLLKGPQAAETWKKVALGVARSSAFLALFCTLAWRSVCTGFQVTGNATVWIVTSSCWVAGLATLVEKKSRRMELALYCVSRALESFALCLGEWGVVRRDVLPRRTDVLLFSAAIAAIMHCYSGANGSHRDVFRSKYLNVLDFVFGGEGVEAGKIRHVPTGRDLLRKIASTASLDSLRTGGGAGSGNHKGGNSYAAKRTAAPSIGSHGGGSGSEASSPVGSPYSSGTYGGSPCDGGCADGLQQQVAGEVEGLRTKALLPRRRASTHLLAEVEKAGAS